MERTLVFKGKRVSYLSREKAIKCESDEECFAIKDVDPEQMLLGASYAIIWRDGHFDLIGDELWTDGKQWIIKATH